MYRRAIAVATLGLVFTIAPRAGAQPTAADRETARHLMDEGDRWVEEKRFDRALESYEAAHALMHVPTTGIEVARTYEALGKLVEAREAAIDVARMPPSAGEPAPFAAARRDAQRIADRLDPRIPTIRIDAVGPGLDPSTVRASVDDVALPDKATLLPRRVNPGKHVVRVRSADRAAVVREVTVAEGANEVVTVDLPASRPSGGLPTLAVVGLGVAGGGVVLGAITGLVSLNAASDARDKCGDVKTSCDPRAGSDIDSAKTWGWVSTFAFGIGLAGAGLATWAIVRDKSAKDGGDRVDVVVVPGGAGVRGAF